MAAPRPARKTSSPRCIPPPSSSAPAEATTSAIPHRSSSSATVPRIAVIFRTDEDGAIVMDTDGRRSRSRHGREEE